MVLPMAYTPSRPAVEGGQYASIAPLEAGGLEGWQQPDTRRQSIVDDLPGAGPLSEPSEATLASLATSTKIQEQLRALQVATWSCRRV
jgi:hypothetical protein